MGKIMFVKKIKISKAELNQRLRQAFLDGYNEGRKDGKRLCLGQKITVGMIKEYLNLLSNEENNNKTTCNIKNRVFDFKKARVILKEQNDETN